MTYLTLQRLGLFAGGVLAFSALSPKWLVAPFAWAAPAFLLILIHPMKPWKGLLTVWAALICAGIISNYGVFPFPFPVMLIMTILGSLINAVPFAAAVALQRRFTSLTSVFIYPSLAVSIEYLSSFSGGGTLGSIAYTQAKHISLIQLASITGIWGIAFVIYLGSSVIYWLFANRRSSSGYRQPVLIFFILLAGVLVFGEVRTNPFRQNSDLSVRVAAITDSNLEPLLTVYAETFNQPLHIDPNRLTQTSPELGELNKAIIRFIEEPLSDRYAGSRRALNSFHDKLFVRAEQEVRGGAKIIAFSEALMFTIKPIEDSLITKGRTFAKKHRVKLLLTMGSLIPGKVTAGTRYIENKALMINENGEVVYVFFKNKPVPMVEGSVQGDGSIPVEETKWGRVATSICYDADFPAHMRQAGRNGVDVMLLPSGDWKEISPFHADVARLRAVENGFSLLRPASGAESIACDQFGRVIARSDYFVEGGRSLIANLPVGNIRTLYTRFGDCFAWACAGYVVFLGSVILFGFLKRLISRDGVTLIRRA